MKYIEKIQKGCKEAIEFLSVKKKELYKSLKPSKTIDIARIAIAAIIAVAALSTIATFLFSAIIILVLVIAVYFLLPEDILKKLKSETKNTTKK